MPCDCRILQSLTKGQVLLVLFETVQRSPLVIDFDSKYDVLVKVSARTYISEYVVLISVDASYLWGQGKRIKIQANYECLQARHSCKAQGEMRAKPDMKPWVNTYKTKKSSDEERHFRREYLSLGVPPLIGAQWMCGVQLTQGLRPGLCRSIALTGLIYVFPIIFWCACSGTISKIYSSSLLLELETIA